MERNNGQWTEGRFKSFITSVIRSGFRRWGPKYEALKHAGVGVRKNKKTGRDAKHYRCADCSQCFGQRDVQVDHKTPIGSCKSWDEFIEKLYCEADNLQVLCRPCHKKKSASERASTKKERNASKENA